MFDPATRNDDRLFRVSDHGSHGGHTVGIRFRTESRHRSEWGFHDHIEISLGRLDILTDDPIQIEMCRTGLAADRFPQCLAERLRQRLYTGHLRAVFGHRRKRATMVDFLIGVALLLAFRSTSGHGKHRGTCQIGILQARRQIRRADRLRHANAGLAGNPCIAVRHIGGRFLSVGHDALDSQRLHFLHRTDGNHRHEEHMRHPIAVQRLSKKSCATHFRHGFTLPIDRTITLHNFGAA